MKQLEIETKRRKEFEESASKKDLEKKSLESRMSGMNLTQNAELQHKDEQIKDLEKASE